MTFDPRLKPCLPVLTAAVDGWNAAEGISYHPILVVAATPRSGRVVRSDRWLEPEELSTPLPGRGHRRPDQLRGLEGDRPGGRPSDRSGGKRNLRRGVGGDQEIREQGHVPLLVILIGEELAVAGKTVAAQKRTVH